MATETKVVQTVIQVISDVKGGQQAKSFLNDFASSMSSLNRVLSYGLFGLGVRQIADFVLETSKMGAQAERVRNSFQQWVGSDAGEWLEKLRAASRGMISDMDLMVGANQALMLQVTDDADTLAKLLEIAIIRGRAMGISTEFAFESIVRGIGRMSPWILDNIGIVTGGAKAYEEYASSIGKAADALSAAEKRQALINKVIQQTPEGLKMLDDTAAIYERIDAAWKNIRRNMGEGLNISIKTVASGHDLADILQAMAEGYRLQNEARKEGLEARTREREILSRLTEEDRKEFLSYINEAKIAWRQFAWGREISPTPGLTKEWLEAAKEYRQAVDEWAEAYEKEQRTWAMIIAESSGEPTIKYPLGAPARTTEDIINRMVNVQEVSSGAIASIVTAHETLEERQQRILKQLAQLTPGTEEYITKLEDLAEVTDKIRDKEEALATRREALRVSQMDLNAQYEYYTGLLSAGNLTEEQRLDIEEKLLTVEKQREQQQRRISDLLFDLALSQTDLNGQIDLYTQKLQQAIPFTEDWLNVIMKLSSLRRQRREEEARETERAAEEQRQIARQRRSEMESLVSGLIRPTPVTEEQFAQTRLGIYSDQWDEYIRRLRSAATDAQSAWKHLIPQNILAQGADAIRVYVDQAERLFYAGRFEEIAGAPPELREQAIRGLVEAAKQEIANRKAIEALRDQVVARLAQEGITGVTEGDIVSVIGTPAERTGYSLGEGLGSGYELWLGSGTWQSLSQETWDMFAQQLTGEDVASKLTDKFEADIMLKQTQWESFGKSVLSWFTDGIKKGVLEPSISEALINALMPKVIEVLTGRP